MPESHAARGTRRGRRSLVTLGEEIRAARLAAGLSQRVVAEAAGISISELSRVERASASWLGIVVASRLAAVVGLDLVLRAYPGPTPMRDASHLALASAFRKLLGPGIRVQTEVAVGPEGDQRAWDAIITGREGRVGVEFETRLIDVQALLRRVNLKRRDGGMDRVLLVFADTRNNRAAVRLAGLELSSGFPLESRAVVSALSSGVLPVDSGCIFLATARG